jgi:hypothetical protein
MLAQLKHDVRHVSICTHPPKIKLKIKSLFIYHTGKSAVKNCKAHCSFTDILTNIHFERWSQDDLQNFFCEVGQILDIS